MSALRRIVREGLGSRFLRESTTLQAASLFNAASNLLGSVALTHMLGAAELSVFYVAIAAYSLLWSLLNLGLASIATSHIAGALRAGENETVAGWIGVFLRLSFALATAALVLAAIVLPPVCERAFALNGERIGRLAVLLTVIPLLDVPRIVASAALQGERRMGSLARVDLGQEICRLVLIVAGALIFGHALGPAIAMLVASACGSLVALDAYRRERATGDSQLPPLVTAWRSRTVPASVALREGVKVGFVRNVDSLAVQTLPTLLLGSLGDQKWVAYLRIAQRMVAMARLFMQGINRTALPALAALAGVRDLVGLRRTYWRASALSGATITLGLLVALPLLPFAIELLFPRDFWEPVRLLVFILAPGLAIVSFSVANDVFYLVTKQMHVAIKLSLLGLVVNTAQIAALVHWLPTYGVAIGLTLTCCWSLVHVAYAWGWFKRHATDVGAAATVAAQT